MAKLFKVIMNILVILFIAALVALFLPTFLGITTVVSDPGKESNMAAGTVAYGSKQNIEDLAAGDTIISVTDDATYLYTISSINTESGELTVTSDENAESETLTLTGTASKLILCVPLIGYIIVALHSTEGMIILALAVALLIILFIIADILCKRKEEDEEPDEGDDDDYFRELATSQARPNKLDDLGTMSIPPVADLMETEAAANAPELDEKLESPEFEEASDSSESEEELEATESEDAFETQEIILEAIEEPASQKESSSKHSKSDSTGSFDILPERKDSKKSRDYEEPEKEETPLADLDAEETTAADLPAAELDESSDFSMIGNALESVLETEQLNETPRSSQPAAPVEQEPVEDTAEEIELAIPAFHLDDLLQEAYAKGEDPQVRKDASTGITFVDYSNCL